MYIYIYTYKHINTYMYIDIYVYMHILIYIYVYIYTYMYIKYILTCVLQVVATPPTVTYNRDLHVQKRPLGVPKSPDL